MGSTTDRNKGLQRLLKAAPWIGGVVLFGGAVIMAVRLGTAATIMWFAFAALAGALLLFWEALRSVLDPDAAGAEGDQAAIVAGEIGDLERRKKGALKALRDLEFEHSIGRLSDEDYKTLREKYRGEAREAMGAIDQTLGTFLTQAQDLVGNVVRDVTKKHEEAKAKSAQANAAEEDEDDEDEGEEDEGAEADESPADEPSDEGAEAAAPEVAKEAAPEKKPVESVPAVSEKAAASAQPEAAKAEAAQRECPSCSTRNDADAVFCKKCAARLQESAS